MVIPMVIPMVIQMVIQMVIVIAEKHYNILIVKLLMIVITIAVLMNLR